ncbi:MAG: MBG domain-containing protein [Bdellovibrionales bacterium]
MCRSSSYAPWASLVAFLLTSVAPCALLANPIDGTVSAGSAVISSSGNTLTVKQSSDKAVIDWRSFDIASGETTAFVQPSSSSITLNRVNSASASVINGNLTANGNIVIINQNGVLFGSGSKVDVNGLVVTTADIDSAKFMAGSLTFDKPGRADATIENRGMITAKDAGLVGLVAPNVLNSGIITAKLGRIHLASGDAVTLDLYGDGLLEVQASGAVGAQLVKNTGTLQAEGGKIAITAAAAGETINSLIDVDGDLVATAVGVKNGKIVIGGAGDVAVKGALDVSSAEGAGGAIDISAKTVALEKTSVMKANGKTDGGTILVNATNKTTVAGAIYAQGETGNGGFIETSSETSVNVADTAYVNTLAPLGATGMWLLDPTDYTIAASGGDETGASVTESLLTSNRTITTAGSIYVNDAVSWSSNILTLNATAGDVNINAVMTASGTAGLAMTPSTGVVNVGLSATGFIGRVDMASTTSLTISGVTYKIITSLGAAGSTTTTDLQGMNGGLAGAYALGCDIDAAETSGWNSGAGFAPIGATFTGKFNGLGHTITGLTINRPSTSGIGLFSSNGSASTVRNVGITNANMTGTSSTGGLLGSNSGTVTNSYTTGSVTGTDYVGGLTGYNGGTITRSYSEANVTGTGSTGYIGGFVGRNGNILSYSYASGTINGTAYVGGFVGYNDKTISYSYATGDVTGTGSYVGGFAGYIGGYNGGYNGTATYSYATGTVHGAGYTGGFVGQASYGYITYSYATGNTYGTGAYTGGFEGWSAGYPTNYSYATGSVSGTSSTGGFVGYSDGGTQYSYATGNVAGTTMVGGFAGQTGNGTIKNNYSTGTVAGTSVVGGFAGSIGMAALYCYWDTTTSGTTIGYSYNYQPKFSPIGLTTPQMKTYSTFSSVWNISKAGTSTPSGSTIWVIYDGYTYPLLKAFLTAVYVTPTSVTASYDGTTYTGGTSGVTYSVPSASGSSSISGSISYGGTYTAAEDAGTYTITASGLYSSQQGYDITFVPGTLTIAPADITITISASEQSKTYGAALNLGTTAYTLTTSGDLYDGDSITGVTLTSAGTAVTAAVGEYAIVASNATGTGVSNYNITYVNGELTVNPAPLTITVGSLSKAYNETIDVNAATYNITSGTLYNGDTFTGLTLTSDGVAATAAAGTYAIVGDDATGTGLDNYAISYVNGTLTVNKASLTITLVDQYKTYGESKDVTYGGNETLGSTGYEITSGTLYNDDTITGVILSSDGAVTWAPVGVYDITAVTPTGTGVGNYDITYISGSLFVEKAPITLTATNLTKIVGTELDPATLSYTITSGQLYNTDGITSLALASDGAAATALVGSYAITISGAAGTGLQYYNITYADGLLTVLSEATGVSLSDTVAMNIQKPSNTKFEPKIFGTQLSPVALPTIDLRSFDPKGPLNIVFDAGLMEDLGMTALKNASFQERKDLLPKDKVFDRNAAAF